MNWISDTIRIALMSLRANKLRSGLTALGVIIGIGTIVGMLSLINGINESVMNEFKRLGPNVIYITREDPGVHVGIGRRERKRITLDEVEALRKRCDSVSRISIVSENRGRVGFRGQKSGMVSIVGVQADYADIVGLDIAEGRFFASVEGRRGKPCIVGSGVIEGLFGKVSPLGKDVEIDGRDFRIVGTLEESGVVLGTNYDDMVVIPYQWSRTIFGEGEHDYVMVLPVRGVELGDAIGDLRLSMRNIRKVQLGKEDGFAVSSQESLMATYKQLTASIYWVMRIVASIALLVSGIGIMNIMLVTVMERTREIGLRKAVGAPKAAIAGQFVVESIVLTLCGGAVGIGLGYLIRVLVAVGTPLPASVPVWAVPLALAICCAIGMFFGLYPAVRASGLDPVKALRYE